MDTKLYILTGFLGSGKTTFLKKVLFDLDDKKVGVVMNEFGKIGIDGELIKKDGMELVELNRGSIFCSCLELSFVSALAELVDRDLDYLFVESSGLSDPSNIAEILDAVIIAKGEGYDYGGNICIVDGENFLDQLEDLETVERQIKFANLVLVSKFDLIDEGKYEKILEAIDKIQEGLKVEKMVMGDLNFDFLSEDLLKNGIIGDDQSTVTPETKPKTLTLSYDKSLKKEDLRKFLDSIKKDSYRIKGFLELEDGLNKIDVVGKRVSIRPYEDGDKERKLVIISRVGNEIIRPIVGNWKDHVGDDMLLR